VRAERFAGSIPAASITDIAQTVSAEWRVRRR
jgi:hypothetical protein